MKNLGKIALSIILFTTFAHASFKVSLDDTIVSSGDSITLNVEVSGENLSAPMIDKLCGVNVEGTAKSTSINIVNGAKSVTHMYGYTFTPHSSCTIDPISMIIDGKTQSSKPIKVTVIAQQKTASNDFELTLEALSQEVYVGEPFGVLLTFKQNINAEAVDSDFKPPKLKNFWIKKESKSTTTKEGNYKITKAIYIMAAQKSGQQTIAPAMIKIASRAQQRDLWGQWMATLKWRSYFSNSIDMNVLPLPQGVSIVGDLRISAVVDKTVIKGSEAVNVTLKIDGLGNLEDIPSQKPSLDNVSVYADKIKISEEFKNKSFQGSWSEKMAFVSDSDFVVPSFKLTFFNPQTKTTQTVMSKAIPIKVEGVVQSKQEEPLKIKRSKEVVVQDVKNFSKEDSIITFLVGLSVGIFITILAFVIPFKKLFYRDKKEKRVNTKDKKALITSMIEYKDDAQVREMIENLESIVYDGSIINIDKKKLKEIIKKYNL
ncbi:MAG: oxygen-tolerance protein [Helicobacteraceae bacterium]|nr:oxygen-tolerance protein [Helicobacteraceae bacterium]